MTKGEDNHKVPSHVIGLTVSGLVNGAEDDVSLYVSTGSLAPG